MEKINLAEKFALIREHWSPKEEEVHLLLFEPASTRNTGNVENERTVAEPGRL